MAKTFKLVDIESEFPSPSTNVQLVTITDWKLCLICQEQKEESLTCPSQSKRKDVGSGYSSLAENLIRFHELGQLPIHLERLDEGNGIEMAMVANSAKYHQSCRLQYNNTKLQRAQKRALTVSSEDHSVYNTCKYMRSQTTDSSILQTDVCFFCGKLPGTSGLHEAATFQVNERVKACAVLLEDTELLAKLSTADMVALEAKYHTKCLVSLYNRARKAKAEGHTDINETEALSGIALAELVMYIEEMRQLDEKRAPVFKLSDLAQLYTSRLEQLGVKLDVKVHTTRLKQRLLTQFTDMKAQKKGRDVLLAFEDDIGNALAKACELDSDNKAIHLARAANIVRNHMFGKSKSFSGFPIGCQKESVSPLLLALVNMILEGPSIKEQSEDTTPAALSIAQLLKFNSIKHRRTQDPSHSVIVKYMTAQETPIPIYIGLMLHAHTRKKELVNTLNHLGISISYDRVLRISAEIGNRVCEQFHREQVVCSPKLRNSVFTSAAVDNIDHNPSSTTSKESFHGTGISLFQHPIYDGEGVDRTVIERESQDCSKSVDDLPHFYTDVPPVNESIKKLSVPASGNTSLDRNSYKQQTEQKYFWLKYVREVLESQHDTFNNISWAAYHASHQPSQSHAICPTALLPLFLESAHTVAMFKHSFHVVKSAIEHLNPGQTPVIAFDQPLYALAKHIQWKWPENYGEDKFVIMFGGLDIEMAALKTLGDWLKGSGWVQALVQANITTPGIADSFLQAAHVTRTIRALQVTVAALYILMHRAYDQYCLTSTEGEQQIMEFKQWCNQREQVCPHFQYWATVMELELCVLVYVRSLRQASFTMYLDALTELTPWFFALDHTNYARWIPVHLKDMAELSTKHPEIAKRFNDGHFTIQKTNRVFSAIPIDQAHEQNNGYIKGDGGAVGLTDNPNALRRWMIAGPEVARIIEEFHDEHHHCGGKVNTKHHDQTPSVQTSFAKDVCSLISVMEELGNPFEEESTDVLILDSKEIADPAVVETIQNVQRLGQEQFQAFIKECLVDKSKSIHDVIHRNKLKLFKNMAKTNVSKGKKQLTSLKSDVGLFSRLYIGCQTRDGNLEEFFRHENQAYPPALSDCGNLYLGTKSDLLVCLEDLSETQSEVPVVSTVVLDGGVIVQMLKPATAVKCFAEYASQIFIPYILSQFQNASCVDLVWDRYLEDTLKGTTRAKRGKGVCRRVVGGALIPGNWKDFLRVDTNKTELYKFLSHALFDLFNEEEKQLVITDGESVLSKPSLDDLTSLSPCNHEEADSRMLLHASHAAHCGHHKVLIRTVDTDVVVLAVSVAQGLGSEYELWLAFGTSTHFRYIAAHKIANRLGSEKSPALPMFHALTGCDTVSSFVGHGKKTAWNTWSVLPELTGALVKLSCAPSDIPEDVMLTVERFVILLYDRTSTCTDINKARQKVFAKRNNIKRIPPTRAALEQHVKRATYQGGHVWGQSLQTTPVLPSPTNWGWTRTDDGLYEPNWTILPEASQVCYELVSCKCKKGCVGQCKCKKAALECTALCACEGECS